jgi:spore coat protein U-like protein
MRRIPIAVLVVVATFMSGEVRAASMGTSFKVTASVVGKCQNVSATNIDFGTVPAGTQATANGTVSVTCNEGVEFLVKLDGGHNFRLIGPGGLDGTRNLAGPLPTSSNLLGYQIYKDPTMRNAWGSACVPFHLGCIFEPGPQGLLGTGSGGTLTLTTFGRIFGAGLLFSQSPPSGNYEDTVNVEVVF